MTIVWKARETRPGLEAGSPPRLRVVPAPPPLQASSPPAPPIVTFDRHELGAILNLYGRKVAAGEWRDYAIDFGRQTAVFSIFTAGRPKCRCTGSRKIRVLPESRAFTRSSRAGGLRHETRVGSGACDRRARQVRPAGRRAPSETKRPRSRGAFAFSIEVSDQSLRWPVSDRIIWNMLMKFR